MDDPGPLDTAERTSPPRRIETPHPKSVEEALTAHLRWLEDGKLVVRQDLSNAVLHVEYKLKEDLREPIIPLLNYLADWASHMP